MRLHDEHFEAVRRYAWRRGPEIADDVAAETFVVAWRRLEDVPEDARPWLIVVARNVRMNILRSQRRQQSLATELRRFEPREEVADSHSSGLAPELARALDALSASDREVLLLHAWDDFDTGQIAAAIGCSKANASVRLHRAKRRFEKALHAEETPGRDASRSSAATTTEGAVDGC